MRRISITSLLFSVLFLSITSLLLFLSCGGNLNNIGDEHFDSDGYLLRDSLQQPPLVLSQPTKMKFYVEVSGSMNGFFRANRATHFKADVWEILNYYSSISDNVGILTNDGSKGASIKLADFQTKMNTGQFVTSASTKVPVMLQSIIDDLDAESGEVAVLISDMKYSPVGEAAPTVLMAQYSTDISKILANSNWALSLIGATSDYLDKSGNIVCERSPYYFLVIGCPEHVGEIRNGISTLLDNRNHFIDNIETGFEYGDVDYEVCPYDKCEQLDNEPTFYSYEEPDDGDTCTITLKFHLENYRWLIAKEEALRACFSANSLHHCSEIKVGKINLEVQNIIEKQLKRRAVATIELKVFNMLADADVIEWKLDLLDSHTGLLTEFLKDANDENDVSKSYSVSDFIHGMFYGGIVNEKLKSNYILITKNSL